MLAQYCMVGGTVSSLLQPCWARSRWGLCCRRSNNWCVFQPHDTWPFSASRLRTRRCLAGSLALQALICAGTGNKILSLNIRLPCTARLWRTAHLRGFLSTTFLFSFEEVISSNNQAKFNGWVLLNRLTTVFSQSQWPVQRYSCEMLKGWKFYHVILRVSSNVGQPFSPYSSIFHCADIRVHHQQKL